MSPSGKTHLHEFRNFTGRVALLSSNNFSCPVFQGSNHILWNSKYLVLSSNKAYQCKFILKETD